MRTTLTLDDDVASALKQQAQLLNQPFKQVVNDSLRRGLAMSAPADRPPFKIKAFSSEYQPGIDPTRLRQIADEFEVEESLRELPV